MVTSSLKGKHPLVALCKHSIFFSSQVEFHPVTALHLKGHIVARAAHPCSGISSRMMLMVLPPGNHLGWHAQSGTVVVVIPLPDSPNDYKEKHPDHQQEYRSEEKGEKCVKKSKHGKSHLSTSFFLIVTDFPQKLNREIG